MPLNAPLKKSRHSGLGEYAVGVVAVLLAFGARLSLDSVLGERLPYQFFYLSIVVAAWYGGLGPGLVAVLLGFFSGNWFLNSAVLSLSAADLTQAAAYLIVGIAISGFGHLVRAKERRLRSEEAAHEDAHLQMATILESITDCFYSLDRQWRYSYINAQAEKFFGINKANLLGQSVWKPFPHKLFPQTEGSEIEYQFRKAMDEQTPVAFEVLSSVNNRWLEVHAYPSRESLSVFFRDITPRKRAEQALREERRILDLAHVFVCDLDHRIMLWNEGAHKLYAWPKEAAVGRIAHELLQTEFPLPFEEIKRILLAEGHWKGELVHQTQDGRRLIVATQWELHRDAEGHPAAILEVNDDITERKRAEEKVQALNAQLQRRVEEFQTLINTAPVGIAVATDPDCNCIWANPEFSRMLGTKLHQNVSTSGAEAPSLPFKILRGDEELAPDQMPMQRACREGREVLDEELQIERTDGVVVHELARATPLRDEHGSVRGCIGVFLDITERKRAEAELRSSEERFRRVVEGAPSAMIMVGIDGRIALVNVLAERLFGYASEEMIGEPAEKLLPERFRSYRENDPAGFFAAGTRPVGSGRDLFGLRKDGSEVPIEINLNPIRTSEGQFVMASIIDITARKAAEMELRYHACTQAAAAELSELALLEGDLSRVFKRAVELLAQTLGVQYTGVFELLPEGNALKLTEGIGWKPGSVNQITVPSDLNGQPGYTLLSSKPMGSGKARVYEAVIVEDVHADSRFKPVQLLLDHGVVSGMTVAIANVNRPYGILAAYTRIRRSFAQNDAAFLETIANILGEALQRHSAEAELRDAKAQLARANEDLERTVEERTAHLNESIRSLERICYNIAHDLRAPNRTMQGFAQALLMDYSDSVQGAPKDYLQRIANAAARNDLLIRDLLAYGRLGHVELPCCKQSLKTHINTVLQNLNEDIVVKKGSVKVEEPLPDVWANFTALEQVLTNLVSNALKFIGKGVRPHVRIWTEPFASHIRVFVEDNGIGIPDEHQQRVFGLFERLHASYPGTGIGLAIVQKSVERMGGKVGVASAPGKGSRFWFELKKAADD